MDIRSCLDRFVPVDGLFFFQDLAVPGEFTQEEGSADVYGSVGIEFFLEYYFFPMAPYGMGTD